MAKKATGVVRKVDELGRIVIPKELRTMLDISNRDPVEIFTDEDSIILKKYKPGCVFCDSVDDLSTVNGKIICKRCLGGILSAIEK